MNEAAPEPLAWEEANQRCLAAALGVVRAALARHVEVTADAADALNGATDHASAHVTGRATARLHLNRDELADAEGELARARAALSAPAPLDVLCDALGLSAFEQSVLLVCAGLELDSRFAGLCAAVHGDARQPYPTFGLALATLPDPHWSALTPAAPLRRWRLVEVGPGDALVASQLRIDERVLHYLTGAPAYIDERLRGLVVAVSEPVTAPDALPESHAAVARQIVTALTHRDASPGGAAARDPLPVIQLVGTGGAGKPDIVAAACAQLGLGPCVLAAGDIPAAPAEREALARLWEREALLSGCALLVDCEGEPAGEASGDGGRVASDDHPAAAAADTGAPGTLLHRVCSLVEQLHGVIILCARHPVPTRRASVRLTVDRPGPAEQRALWQRALGPAAAGMARAVDAVVDQFQLDVSDIRTAGAVVRDRAAAGDGPRALWDVCRARARAGMDHLARRIDTTTRWDDLVLPARQRDVLRAIAVHLRQRAEVHERWGWGRRPRGLGIGALFSGPSGTGKTLAAEVLAAELDLDLYRVDLSAVVSKYIGETEKNLRRVFDRAERGGAILLFDEADALFGKRTEVRDSHDRYANLEVSYLLQRMEAYRGLAILTTNLRDHLDPAFVRRLRFIVEFPFPDADSRGDIWRRVFPGKTPTDGLDWDRLAQLHIAGGHIFNIALAAAVLAADAGAPVGMEHILRATRAEYAKLGRSLTDAELRGWPREGQP